ncbi:MAG: hypothetical protein SFU57_01455 [Gemmatimonadales bacterium]|nr:hypothetical protein [Gemmatimonadales bacterium]
MRPAWTASEPFTTLTSVRELANGSVLAVDFSEPAVYLITAAGQTSRQLGRKGSGPGEYLTPVRLIPLPNDSTLLLDRDANRYLIIAPDGGIVVTTPFPEEMKVAGQFVQGADRLGRLYFQTRALPTTPTGPFTTAVLRWDRRTTRFDSVAAVRMPVASPLSGTLSDGSKYVGMRVLPFAPADDWVVAPDGRVATVRATPYRLEWHGDARRRAVVGAPVSHDPVLVTERDRQRQEPQGPPYRLTYPKHKPAFVPGSVILDDQSRAWVRRQVPFGASMGEWDIFDGSAKYVKTVRLSTRKRILAVTARFIYVARTDDDDVQWLEAYSR